MSSLVIIYLSLVTRLPNHDVEGDSGNGIPRQVQGMCMIMDHHSQTLQRSTPRSVYGTDIRTSGTYARPGPSDCSVTRYQGKRSNIGSDSEVD